MNFAGVKDADIKKGVFMNLDFTDLVLLIGTSPLPDYVAVKYFTEKNSKLNRIWMVCSAESDNQASTEKYAELLKDLLKDSKLKFQELIYIKDIDSKEDIESKLEKMINKSEKVHLFFTGGTKAMAVYSYSYLKDKKKGDFSASYLSARSFKIEFDDEVTSDDLKDVVKITFNRLLKLHLFEEKKDKTDEYTCFNSVDSKFEGLIDDNKIDNFYSKDGGFQREIFKIEGKDFKIFKNLSDPGSDMRKSVDCETFFQTKLDELRDREADNFKLRVNIFKKISEYKPNDVFQGIINAFPEGFRLRENGKFNTDIMWHNYKNAVDFIDGFWFERYIKKLIQNNFKNDFDEILFNKELSKKDNNKDKFELDLILMKGYQLIGISCTTSKEKHICKEKGFEIVLRTRQIGGEEAKAILITRAETVSDLQSELILSTGTNNKNILVLGIDDWPENKFVKKMKGYFSN